MDALTNKRQNVSLERYQVIVRVRSLLVFAHTDAAVV